MTPFVWEQVCRVGRVWAAEHKTEPQAGIRQIAKALCHRINAEIAACNKEVKAGTSFAITVVDATLAFLKNHYGCDTDQSEGKKTFTAISAFEHAKGISLNRQVSVNNTLRLQ